MAKLTPKKIELWGTSDPYSTIQKVGSLVAGSPVTSTNPDILMQNAPNGWGGATFDTFSSSYTLPIRQEMNGLDYSVSYYLKQLQQSGIAEYVTDQEYFENDLVKEPSGKNVYSSLIDNNIGNSLADNTKWKLVFNADGFFTTQLQSNVLDATGTNNYVLSPASNNVLPENLVDNLEVKFIIPNSNTTTAVTLTVTGLYTSRKIFKLDGTSLFGATDFNAGDLAVCVYDSTLDSGNGGYRTVLLTNNPIVQTNLLPRGYIRGFGSGNSIVGHYSNALMYPGGSSNAILFFPCEMKSSDNTTDIKNNTTITKTIANFVAGDNNGGKFFSSALIDGWYPCFTISNSDGSIVDFGFDNNINCTNIPSGFTKFRYTGFMRVIDGSIIPIVYNRHIATIPQSQYYPNQTLSQSTTITPYLINIPTFTAINAYCNIASLNPGGAGTVENWYIWTDNSTAFIGPLGLGDGNVGSVDTGSDNNSQITLLFPNDSAFYVSCSTTDGSRQKRMFISTMEDLNLL